MFDEHLKRLQQVVSLEKSGLPVQPIKCRFGLQEIRSLDQIVNAEGSRSEPEKIRALTEFSRPKQYP